MRKSEPRLALVLLGIFLALAAGEFLLRLKIIPNHYHESAALSPDGEKMNPRSRLLILGDSFMNNWKTGWSPYEFLLKNLEPLHVQVLNTAFGGSGPREYLESLGTYGKKFGPGVILLSYYVGNDLTNVQYEKEREMRHPLKRFLKSYLDQFYLYKLSDDIRDRWFLCGLRSRMTEDFKSDPELAGAAGQHQVNPFLFDLGREKPNYILDNLLIATEENQNAWRETRSILAKIHRLSQEMNAKLVIVIYPHTVQINRSHFDFFRKLHFNLDENTLTSDKPQGLLKDFCRQKEIPCLDLLPAFRQSRDAEFYQPFDDHLNARGSKKAARSIFNFLKIRAGKGG